MGLPPSQHEKYKIPENDPGLEHGGDTYAESAETLLCPDPSTPIEDFKILSSMIKGFRAREFSILCGATGVGKTTLLANWSASLLKQKVPHYVASVETGRHDFFRRVFSALIGRDWNTGDRVSLEDFKNFDMKYRPLFSGGNLTMSVYENRFHVRQLMSSISHAIDQNGCKIAFVDNLNFFMEIGRASDQIVEMDKTIHDLVMFCKEVDVHVVMVMHPKKTDHGRVESEFDIKGSSTAVQEASNIFLFNRPHSDFIRNGTCLEGDREIRIAKVRRIGKANGKRIFLRPTDCVHYRESGFI